MRRLWIICVLCLCVLTGSAAAWASVTKSQKASATGKTKATAALAGAPVLFGDQAVENGRDANSNGLAETFAFTNSTDGTRLSEIS